MFNVSPTIPRLAGAILAASLFAAPVLAGEFVFVPEGATEGFEPQSSRFKTLLVSPDADLRDYSSVTIRSVIVKPRDRDTAKRMNSADRSELTRKFRTYFTDGLGDRLTKKSGEGTLVLSAAITHAWPNRDLTGRYVHTRGATTGSASSTGLGSASFEAVLKDARTGKVVAVIADSYSGSNFPSNPNANSRWGDASDGFRRWGQYLSRELGGPSAS